MSPTFKQLKADCEDESKKETLLEKANSIKGPLEQYMAVCASECVLHSFLV